MTSPQVLVPGPFSDLVYNQEDLKNVALTFMHTIKKSFYEDRNRDGRVPSVTEAEIKRRYQICEAHFRDARGGVGWSLQRALDTLPIALRAKLDGKDFTYSAHQGWAVPDSERESTIDSEGRDYSKEEVKEAAEAQAEDEERLAKERESSRS